jgi:hypothetical protein
MTQSDAEVEDLLSALAGLARREREELEGSDLSGPILSELTATEIAAVHAGVLKRLQATWSEPALVASSKASPSRQVVPLRRWGPFAVLLLWPAVTTAAAVVVALQFIPDATPRAACPRPAEAPNLAIAAPEAAAPFLPLAEAGNSPVPPEPVPQNPRPPEAVSRALSKEAQSFLLRAEQAAAKAAEAVARGLSDQHPEVIRWRATERRWRARASELLAGTSMSKKRLGLHLGSDHQRATRSSFR